MGVASGSKSVDDAKNSRSLSEPRPTMRFERATRSRKARKQIIHLALCFTAALLTGCVSSSDSVESPSSWLPKAYPFSTDVVIGASAFSPAKNMKTTTRGVCEETEIMVTIVNTDGYADVDVVLAGRRSWADRIKDIEILNTQIRCTTQASGHVATIIFLTRSTDGPEIMVFDTREKRIFLK